MDSRRAAPGRGFALALGLVAFVAPLAVHLFLPMIPAVKAALGLSEAVAQLNFSIALFAMALSTLAYGTLSDRWGRRPVLLSGLVLFLVGSAGSGLAQTGSALVLGRVVQAIGAGCGMTLVRTIARDAYRDEHLIRAIAYLTMFYTLGPMIAPVIGGVLIDTLGWRSVFGFALAAGGAITLVVYAMIGETLPASERVAREIGVLRGYADLFSRPKLVGYVLQSGFNTAAFMTMASAAATLMKELLQRPSSEFGFYFLLFPLGFFFGNLISSRIGNRVSNEAMVLAGSLLAVTTVALQAWLLLSGHVSAWTFFIPGFFITFSQGISLPYAQVGAMAVVPRLAGTAAGIGVFMQNFGGAVFTQLYGLFADGTPRPMIIIAGCSAILCLAAGALPFALAQRVAAGGKGGSSARADR
jgi:DHA1 family bicyclomycin/chloramphenicol resistance-like MFS transporter